jgi:hydroxymethylbilane synthase
MKITIATRGSALARAQSGLIGAALAAQPGCEVDYLIVSTQGDQSAALLDQIGGTGVFVTAVREAVLAGEAELCIHSLKDLPTASHSRLSLAAVPKRESPWDVLVSAGDLALADLPTKATVGTGSPRRAAQLRLIRPDLRVLPIRGNVPSRIHKVDTGELDAVVLAEAGLRRLGLGHRISSVLLGSDMLPAPAQGALGIEWVEDQIGADLAAGVLAQDHRDSRAEVVAERAALATLEVGCTSPMGARAVVNLETGSLELKAAVFGPPGTEPLRVQLAGSAQEPALLGVQVAEELLSQGAAKLVGEKFSWV